MKYLSILIGKIAIFVLEKLNRGSSLPGTIAKKLNKNILKNLEKPKLSLAVTGSSGKGSTTKLINKVFKEFGYKVAYNNKGSNEEAAIITTLLKNSTLTGKTKVDVSLFEIDERYVKYVFKDFQIDHLIITNVTKDQPPRQRHFDFICDEIKKGLNKDIKLTLNADDPILDTFINESNDITYYSLNKTKKSYKKNMFEVLNTKRCKICNEKLDYEYYHIEDIGKYNCPKCNIDKNIINQITNIDYENKIITIDKEYKIKVENDMLYNFYNVLAAFTLCNIYLKDKEKIANILSNATDKKIYNKKTFNKRNVYILNNKCENATTYNESVLYTKEDKKLKTLVIGWYEISRRYNKDDISWLYDIDFELIKNIDKVIVCGPQRYDIAVRMKLAGIDQKKIIIKDTINDIKESLIKSKGEIYAILNFDYVEPFNSVIKEDL